MYKSVQFHPNMADGVGHNMRSSVKIVCEPVFLAILVLLNINILLPTSGENYLAILGIKSEVIADNFMQLSAWFGECMSERNVCYESLCTCKIVIHYICHISNVQQQARKTEPVSFTNEDYHANLNFNNTWERWSHINGKNMAAYFGICVMKWTGIATGGCWNWELLHTEGLW